MPFAGSRQTLWDDHRVVLALGGIQAFCGTVFALDIAYETHLEWVDGVAIPPIEIIHVGFEIVAVFMLFAGFVFTRKQWQRLQMKSERSSELLGSLRGHFDDIIQERFHGWGLSAAECDIALLSLRGVKIADIAAMRHTRDGTIKAQLSAIYRKSGLGTRTEFLAYFMDEFLDYGAVRETPPVAMANKAHAALTIGQRAPRLA